MTASAAVEAEVLDLAAALAAGDEATRVWRKIGGHWKPVHFCRSRPS